MFYCLAVKSTGGVQIWCPLQNCRSSLTGTGAGKFANSLALSPNLCLNPSIRDLAEPHNHGLFFSLEAHSHSHLISPFFYALWLNISHSCVFSLWGSTALIANQLDSSSAGSGSKALPNFSRLLCVHLLLLWVGWDRWVMEAAPPSFRPWLVM